MEIPEARTKLE